MATRYIYLSDELNNKLKEEENVSRLVSNLLNAYYKQEGKKDPLYMNELQTKRDQGKKLQEQIEEELSILTKTKEEQDKEKEAEEQRIKEKKEQQRISINNYFKFLMDRDMTDEEMEEYLIKFSDGKYSIYDFAKEKGYKDESKNEEEEREFFSLNS